MMKAQDLQFLLGRPEFRLFLFSAIQLAGIFQSANGRDQRDLSFFEGRRSLGLDLLKLADEGQPDALRTPEAQVTLSAIIKEAMNPASQPKEKPRADRYAEIPE